MKSSQYLVLSRSSNEQPKAKRGLKVALAGSILGLALVGAYMASTEALHEDIAFFGDSLH